MIRPMTLADIELGMRLKIAASWNQTEMDWQRTLALEPDGCFVAMLNDVPVGTISCCIFGSVAWIGMLLVDPAHRRRGIATRLMDHMLRHLDRRAIPSIRLDATDMGRPLYERLGFHAQFVVDRHEGVPNAATGLDEPGLVRPFESDQLQSVRELDRIAVGVDRGNLLDRLHAESPRQGRTVERDGRLQGFSLLRRGTHATQLGPVIARNPTAGHLLLAEQLDRHRSTPVYVDVPVDNSRAAELARDTGLRVQRSFTRMCRGKPSMEKTDWLWASGGPEKG